MTRQLRKVTRTASGSAGKKYSVRDFGDFPERLLRKVGHAYQYSTAGEAMQFFVGYLVTAFLLSYQSMGVWQSGRSFNRLVCLRGK